MYRFRRRVKYRVLQGGGGRKTKHEGIMRGASELGTALDRSMELAVRQAKRSAVASGRVRAVAQAAKIATAGGGGGGAAP